MKYVAEMLNNIFIDKQVYGLNKSIRLPNSFKYVQKKNEYEERYYPVNECDYLKYVVNNVEDCIDYQEWIAITMKEFYQINTHCQNSYKNLNIEGAIYEKKQEGKIYVTCTKGYVCPSNPNIFHESNNGVIYTEQKDNKINHVFQCFSDKCNKSKYILEVEDDNQNIIEKAINTTNIILNDLPITHNQRYLSDPNNWIDFKEYYENNNVYICSPLGSGKTELILDWMNHNFKEKNIIYVSFWKTLTNNITDRLNMVSYETINGPIFIKKHKRVAVQIESIKRIVDLPDVDLIIFDEIDSIMTHISQSKSAINKKIESFIDLIKIKTTKIYLDAYINSNHIKIIQSIRDCDKYIINNIYKPWEETIIIHDYKPTKEYNKIVIDNVLKCLRNGEWLVCPIVSWEFGDMLVNNINQVFGESKKISYYHGLDEKYDEENKEFHKAKKRRDLLDLNNTWKKLDVLIYTGTITAGVSFDFKHFDKIIGVYCNNASQANYFVQSLLRCWQFKQNTHEIYISPSHIVNESIIPKQIFKKINLMINQPIYELFKHEVNINAVLQAKNNQINKYSTYYICDALKLLGFNLKYEECIKTINNDIDLTKNKLDYLEYFENYPLLDYVWFSKHIKNVFKQEEIKQENNENDKWILIRKDIYIWLN